MRLPIGLLVFLLSLAAPAAGAGSLKITRLASGAVQLRPPGELGRSWQEVAVGRLVLRTPAGSSSRLSPTLPKTSRLAVEGPARGCGLLQVDLGPAAVRGRSDAWWRMTRCSKVVVCRATGRPARDRAAREEIGPVLTAKTGSRIEIRPLFNPLVVPAGGDLPVRAYFEGRAVAAARVVGRGPGGVEVEARSDRVGIANLTLPAAGAWTLSFEHRSATAELSFESAADRGE